jgi:hypothetical protein
MSENIFCNDKTPDDILLPERSHPCGLFEKIKQIVTYDFSNANNITTKQIEKQTNRLFQACMLSKDNESYIIDRYNEINCRK